MTPDVQVSAFALPEWAISLFALILTDAAAIWGELTACANGPLLLCDSLIAAKFLTRRSHRHARHRALERMRSKVVAKNRCLPRFARYA